MNCGAIEDSPTHTVGDEKQKPPKMKIQTHVYADLSCHLCGVLLAPHGYITGHGQAFCEICYTAERTSEDLQSFLKFGPFDPLHPSQACFNVCIKQIVNQIFPAANRIMECVYEAEHLLESGEYLRAHGACDRGWKAVLQVEDKKQIGGDVLFSIAFVRARTEDSRGFRYNAYTWAIVANSFGCYVTRHSQQKAIEFVTRTTQILLRWNVTPAHMEKLKEDALLVIVQPDMYTHRTAPCDNLPILLEHILSCACCLDILYEPCSLPTGHTICKQCVIRSLELTDPYTGAVRRPLCPLTRKPLDIYAAWINRDPRNLSTAHVIEVFLSKYYSQQTEERRIQSEAQMKEYANNTWIPIFVCTVAWPGISCPLHVFEPRYRLMMRRVIGSGSLQYGMCPYLSSDIGTMCQINSHRTYLDGRMLISSTGTYRFRIVERAMQDGYQIAKIEHLLDADDISVPLSVNDYKALSNRELILSTYKNLHVEVTKWLCNCSPYQRQIVIKHFGHIPQEPFLFSMWLCALFLEEHTELSFAYTLMKGTSLNTRLQHLAAIVKSRCQ